MSGVCAAASCLAETFIPPPPLFATVQLNSSKTTFNVSGASGDLYTQFGIVLVIIDGGGVHPFSPGPGDGMVNDGAIGGSGVPVLVAASDGVHNTIGWTGMAVGSYITGHYVHSIVDSNTPPSYASDVFPRSSGSFILHRIS